MGLQLKLSKVSLSTDGTTLTVQDTTGDYDGSTNIGGYGTPNPDRPAMVQLRWKMYRDSAWTLVTGGYTQSDIEAGYAITTINLSFSTVLNLLPDGVEEIQYLGGYTLGGTVTTIPGESTITVIDMDVSTLAVGMYLSFQSDSNNFLYQVLSISGSIITLDTPYGGTNTTDSCSQWYTTILDVLVQTFGQNQINDRLTRFTADGIPDNELTNLTKLTMDELSAGARFDAGDIAGANDLALSVQVRCLKQPYNWS